MIKTLYTKSIKKAIILQKREHFLIVFSKTIYFQSNYIVQALVSFISDTKKTARDGGLDNWRQNKNSGPLRLFLFSAHHKPRTAFGAGDDTAALSLWHTDHGFTVCAFEIGVGLSITPYVFPQRRP